jgi:hypothetical protein
MVWLIGNLVQTFAHYYYYMNSILYTYPQQCALHLFILKAINRVIHIIHKNIIISPHYTQLCGQFLRLSTKKVPFSSKGDVVKYY